jgi:hypothetical protein
MIPRPLRCAALAGVTFAASALALSPAPSRAAVHPPTNYSLSARFPF